MHMKAKCVLYGRVSTEDQKDTDNVSTQLMKLQDVLNERKDREVVGQIQDEGISGQIFERPGLQTIIKMAEEGSINEVWVTSMDRLSRDADLTGHIKFVLRRKGVKVVALDDKGDAFVNYIYQGIGAIEVDKYKDRRELGVERAIKEKRILYRPPFGFKIEYKYDDNGKQIPKTGVLVPDGDLMYLIQQIYDEPRDIGIKKVADKYDVKPSIVRNIRNNPIYDEGKVMWRGKVVYEIDPIVKKKED
jgi:DNA invertase Pin-like site-specific DNA recombinase